MPPKIADLESAKRLANLLVTAGRERIRRIVLLGSRARGTARPTSDFDILVLVEPPSGRTWGPNDVLREKQQLQQRVGRPPVSAELWVRTVDQFEEAKELFGGVESLVASEGVEVYSMPLTRPPRKRRTPKEVRSQLVGDWLKGSSDDLRSARSHAAQYTPNASADRTAVNLVDRCVERAVMALCVLHDIRTYPKAESMSIVLTKIGSVDPGISSAISKAIREKTGLDMAEEVFRSTVLRCVAIDPGVRLFVPNGLPERAPYGVPRDKKH